VHMLMGEDNAGVNLLAGGEDEVGDGGETEGETEGECGYEWEYEDGGWWVGTVGVVETLEETEEAPCTTTGLGLAQGDVQGTGGMTAKSNGSATFKRTSAQKGRWRKMSGGTWNRIIPTSRRKEHMPYKPSTTSAPSMAGCGLPAQ
jgi:hypothetical protein